MQLTHVFTKLINRNDRPMPYNRISAASRFRYVAVRRQRTRKPAFVPVPQGLVAGGLQPWQRDLYRWAREAAAAATKLKSDRGGRNAFELN